LKKYPAELNGHSHGTDVAEMHHIYFTTLSNVTSIENEMITFSSTANIFKNKSCD